MSFGASNNSKKLKPFVTEDEARDITEKRQQEWERVRRPEDPIERPEEEHRSLFEQLQKQKEKVQQEHDEKYNLKNMIRGIDNDEATFLEFASQQQAEMDGRRFAISSEVHEFRSEVAQLHTAVQASGAASSIVNEKKKPGVSQSNKKSQVELLAGVIRTKRKRSETDDVEQEKPQEKLTDNTDCPINPEEGKVEAGGKKQCVLAKSDDDQEELGTAGEQEQEDLHSDNVCYSNISAYKPVGIPSINVYSDSSDSESSSSDSDILPSLFTFNSRSAAM